MKITAVRTRFEPIALSRPYTIAFRTIDAVVLGFVDIEAAGGAIGRGCASPERFVTGETEADCRAALAPGALDWLVGEDVTAGPGALGALPRLLRHHRLAARATPAARAAVDIALHDLFAQSLERPLVEILGRAHDRLPTSVTIGIKARAETLAEAGEYLERGFRALKIKLGHDLEEDIARVLEVRSRHAEVAIRVDANQGYDAAGLERFAAATAEAAVELIEQPLAAADVDGMRALDPDIRRRIAADEALLDVGDALSLATPGPDGRPACGIFNIKLMKAGGVGEGLAIARIAEAASIELMWGCMDESRISIAAALHAALSSPATRYLDLDGSFDLATDPARGGFLLENGQLSTLPAPGLGID
jgi:L-alanine-DL-glutamate epimerase-like enolase superfamily enzyme